MKIDQEAPKSEKETNETEANKVAANKPPGKSQKSYHKKSLKFYGILFLLLVIGYWGVQQYINGLCGTEKVVEELSPDNKLKALVYNYNCGAETASSTHISIVDRDKEKINESGNVFISKGYPHEVSVNWLDSKTLKINANRETVFRELDEFKDIKIVYVGKKNPPDMENLK